MLGGIVTGALPILYSRNLLARRPCTTCTPTGSGCAADRAWKTFTATGRALPAADLNARSATDNRDKVENAYGTETYALNRNAVRFADRPRCNDSRVTN